MWPTLVLSLSLELQTTKSWGFHLFKCHCVSSHQKKNFNLKNTHWWSSLVPQCHLGIQVSYITCSIIPQGLPQEWKQKEDLCLPILHKTHAFLNSDYQSSSLQILPFPNFLSPSYETYFGPSHSILNYF